MATHREEKDPVCRENEGTKHAGEAKEKEMDDPQRHLAEKKAT